MTRKISIVARKANNMQRVPDARVDVEALIQGGVDALTTLHISLPGRPMRNGKPLEPEWPEDLSRCTSRKLGRLHGEYTAMAGYAESQLALVDTRQLAAKHNEKMVLTLQELRGTAKTVKGRAANALVSEDAQSEATWHLRRVAEFKLIRALLEDYIRKQKAVSREIARRDSLESRNT